MVCGFIAGAIYAAREKKAGTDQAISEPALSANQRVRYMIELERLRYRLHSGPDSPSFSAEAAALEARKTVAEQDDKARLLEQWCGISIDDQMLAEEAERMKNDYENKRVMLEIAKALDRDPVAIVEVWIRPVLVDRYLRACVDADPAYNAGALEQAQKLRTQVAKGERTEEGRALTINTASENVDPEISQALGGTYPGELTDIIDDYGQFEFYKIGERSGNTVTATEYSVAKPGFEMWFDSNRKGPLH